MFPLERVALALSVLVAVPFLAAPADGQLCLNPTDNFYKNDILPQIPSGSVAVSLIPGLCENEAAGSVFDLPPGSPPQQLGIVGAPWGDNFGIGGFLGLLNVEVYDGVTFDALGNATMGPKVFDLNQVAGADMQVTSHGINALDLTPFNVVVGNAPGQTNFVVAFRVNFNPNGSCASGYTANFFTDNSQPGLFGCDATITPPNRNLIDILGQGWVDASKAKVTGIPLCPLYYAGNWVIRACSSDATGFNPLNVTVIGNPVPPGGFANLTFNAPGFENQLYVAAAALTSAPGIPLPPYGTVPLNPDPIFWLSLDAAASGTFVNFSGLIGSLGTAPALVIIPADPTLSGVGLYVAFVAVPTSGAWGISSPGQIAIQ